MPGRSVPCPRRVHDRLYDMTLYPLTGVIRPYAWGSRKLLAELQGRQGQRVLRCAACGAGWKYPRTRCAHCGNQDQRTLHYLAVEEQAEKYRVDLCDRCHGYLKSVTSFEPTPAELLTIEDAAMLHLEAIAQERGYTNDVRSANDEVRIG